MENKPAVSAPVGQEIQWDSEERSDWSEREGHLREKRMAFRVPCTVT